MAPTSDWSRWEADGRLPPSGDGSGFASDYEDDLALYAGLGLGAVRLTIDWARLEPHPGRWDTDAADHVTEVLRSARANGLEVWAVLHDGPLPGWFSDDQGGFADEAGRRRTWPRHVDRVAEQFGDLVAAWVPVLDPLARATEGFLDATRPPGRADPRLFLEAVRDLHLASFEAWRLLSSGDPLVACCIDAAPIHPGVRSREPDERDEAERRAAAIDRIRSCWTRELRDGVVSVPGLAEIELPELLGAYDVVGVTYRGATTAYADGTLGPYPADAPVAPDGRSPWTEGLGVVLRRLADELPGRSFAVLGTGLTAHEDDWRTEVLEGTARQLEQAVADGLPVTHAFWESVVDGWTPECGLAVPDGVVTRGRERRLSADALQAVAARHAKLGE